MSEPSWHEIGLTAAVADLDALRVKLRADDLRASWKLAGGRVVVIVPGPSIMVNGVEVPMKDSA